MPAPRPWPAPRPASHAPRRPVPVPGRRSGTAGCQTSMVTAHDHPPSASGAQASPDSEAALGAAPMITTVPDIHRLEGQIDPAVGSPPHRNSGGNLPTGIQTVDDLLDGQRPEGRRREPAARWHWMVWWHPAPLTSAKLSTRPRTASAMQSSRVGPHASMRRSAV
jgi:hypothetical protein